MSKQKPGKPTLTLQDIAEALKRGGLAAYDALKIAPQCEVPEILAEDKAQERTKERAYIHGMHLELLARDASNAVNRAILLDARDSSDDLSDRLDYFALRPGESFELWHVVDHADPRFVVCLAKTPPLPTSLTRHAESRPFYVLCMAKFSAGWGWCPLAANTKDHVGSLLEKAGAQPGHWFVMAPSSTYSETT